MNKQTVKLKNVASYSTKRISASELAPSTYVGTDNINQNKTGKSDATYTPTSGNVSEFQVGDILIGNIRPYLKKIWYADIRGGSSADVLTIRTTNDKFDSKFIYYALFRDDFFDYMMQGSKGSKMPRGDKKQVLDFPIPDIEKTTQQKIAGVLSTLDDKIELNRRESAELEQMARTLYDYWFVQFDFPRSNGKPYKTSGGPMKFSPELNRQIPTDWGVKKLDDIISRSGTGLNPRQNFKLGQGENYYVTIKNVENSKIILDDKCDKVDDEALKIIQKRSDLQPGDVLFTSIQPVGVTYLIHEKPTNWNINESVFTIRPNYEKVTSEYLYMLLSSDEMKVYTTNSSAGSVHKGIRHAVLKDFNAVIVPKEVIDAFSEKIKPILEKMYKNDQQSQNLAHLRDWLLPLLMNGQVSVE